MRKNFRGLVLAAAAAGALSMMVLPAVAADAVAAPAAHYSVSTTLVGKMLDDPAANAVLKKLIPTVYANDMFQSSGRELTLKSIQQYEPEALSDENLAKIQAELDKIPAKG
jgi:para-nitrobenzyl esterase